MAFKLCKTCGARWTDNTGDQRMMAKSYFFSTALIPKGTYTYAVAVVLAAGDILTCPLDPRAPKSNEGRTPSGGDMSFGDDRLTTGDETDPSKDEL